MPHTTGSYLVKVLAFSIQCINIETETFFDQDIKRYVRYSTLIQPLTANNHLLN